MVVQSRALFIRTSPPLQCPSCLEDTLHELCGKQNVVHTRISSLSRKGEGCVISRLGNVKIVVGCLCCSSTSLSWFRVCVPRMGCTWLFCGFCGFRLRCSSQSPAVAICVNLSRFIRDFLQTKCTRKFVSWLYCLAAALAFLSCKPNQGCPTHS